MADVVNSETRSRMMSGIRGKNTKPEILIRSLLHRRGFRFRLHDKKLPGKPDIVLPRYRAVILIHGCFWHGHDCHLFKEPASNSEFWRNKISGNRLRDEKTKLEILEMGWRMMTVWECALKGKSRLPLENVVRAVADWIESNIVSLEIRGGDSAMTEEDKRIAEAVNRQETELVDKIEVLEFRISRELASRNKLPVTGYGRDYDEARIHAGWGEYPVEGEKWRVVTVRNLPGAKDRTSKRVCLQICSFHMTDDQDIPLSVRMQLCELVEKRLYAAAISFCFDSVWDRLFENE